MNSPKAQQLCSWQSVKAPYGDVDLNDASELCRNKRRVKGISDGKAGSAEGRVCKNEVIGTALTRLEM